MLLMVFVLPACGRQMEVFRLVFLHRLTDFPIRVLHRVASRSYSATANSRRFPRLSSPQICPPLQVPWKTFLGRLSRRCHLLLVCLQRVKTCLKVHRQRKVLARSAWHGVVCMTNRSLLVFLWKTDSCHPMQKRPNWNLVRLRCTPNSHWMVPPHPWDPQLPKLKFHTLGICPRLLVPTVIWIKKSECHPHHLPLPL